MLPIYFTACVEQLPGTLPYWIYDPARFLWWGECALIMAANGNGGPAAVTSAENPLYMRARDLPEGITIT